MKSLRYTALLIVLLLISLVATVIFNFSTADVVQAETASVCKKYANEAVEGWRRAQGNRCGFSGVRWQSNFTNHYNWCLQAPADAVINESRVRDSLLGVCSANISPGSYLGSKYCDQYAKQAVQQQGKAKSIGCSFSGNRWNSTYEDHLTWCTYNSSYGHTNSPDSEARARETDLNQCQSRRPGNGSSGPFSPPSKNQHCAASCDVCTSEGLRCTTSLTCSQYPTTAPWLCY